MDGSILSQMHAMSEVLMNKLTMMILVLPLLLVAACGDPSSDGKPIPDYFTYHVRLNETVYGRLTVNTTHGHMTVDHYDTNRRRLALGEEEQAEFLVMFGRERSPIYLSDTNREDGTITPGLDCSLTQHSYENQTICQAQEIAHLEVNAIMGMPPTEELEQGLYASLFFQAPVDLSLETAEAIVFVEAMRIRTEEEGALVGGE